jgi:2-oxoglutarate ferredoxin oxidoreductase subunit alpha
MSAARAGVKLAASYPMSPSTGVFTVLAGAADEYGIVVEQAESEIAAINMICGATYAGVPAITTTSGGGFALMCEGLSLAGIMELPVVIVLAQRPGPATGLPTRTGQEDLKFAVNGGHGEFARIVLAPGTIRQAGLLTRHAIEMAHKYQTPAIVLVDQHLVDMQKNLPPADDSYRPIDRCIVDADEGYQRYALTDSGISPRAIPGGAAVVVSDSDEHTCDGHLTEDLVVRVEQVDKRLRKLEGLRAEALPPERYGLDDAETLLICWGSTCGPAAEAVDLLGARNRSVASLHFAQPHPLNVEVVRQAVGNPDRIVCVEGNATGQFASLLKEASAIGSCDLMGRYDGLPFTGEEIARRLDE